SNIELIRITSSEEFNEANRKLIKVKKGVEVSDDVKELGLGNSNVKTSFTRSVRQKAQIINLKIDGSHQEKRLIKDKVTIEVENHKEDSEFINEVTISKI
ncbi:hypothetical protein WA026_015870, partial [Henosepilachna vigintioctopunctata]